MRTLTVKSHKQVELIDITHDVIKTILEDNITEGLAVIYTPHTTAAIPMMMSRLTSGSAFSFMVIAAVVTIHQTEHNRS